MNWFERHLNWSLFLGVILLPTLVAVILSGIFFAMYHSEVLNIISSGGGESEIQAYMLTVAFPFAILYILVELASIVFIFLVTWWYVGQKARNKWLLLLLFVPFGFIILLLLKNKAIGYGGDFADESATSRWPDTGPYSAPDDRQLKELDYTPAKNVMDMVDGGNVKDVKDIKEIEDVSAASVADEEAPAEEKAVKRAVSAERLKMPILLDDVGAVITCFYHPGADAVNLCSRCKQYVCSECSYVTGTNPICRNCWEKRAESPIIAVPAEKQKGVEPSKPKKQKDVESGKGEQQKTVASGKSERPKSKKNEWLGEFMALYEQASPIINVVTRKSADSMPASPLDLMEGLKLRPMLELAKKLSKPKEKELREAKNEFEQVLSSCIKIADAAADFVSGGGQALLGGPDFARIVDGIETANGLMGNLSQRLTAFPHFQE